MDLFETLRKNRLRNDFESSSEMRFFLENADVLTYFPLFKKFKKASSGFDVIRGNVILRSLSNKEIIESAYRLCVKEQTIPGTKIDPDSPLLAEAMGKAKSRLPYFELNGRRIYVPVLPLSFNSIYEEEYAKLDERPYSSLLKDYDAALVDPFDYYGPDLFDSYFTRLLKVGGKGGYRAFLDYDSFSLYFVNEQGRLDVECALFDRFLDRPSYNHLQSRVAEAVSCYYKDDRKGFIKALVDNKLISSSLAYRIYEDEKKFYANLASRVDKHGQ